MKFGRCQAPGESRVRARFLQRAHVLANEAAARAGRGQAIAPTMDDVAACAQHSRGDGLSSPCSPCKNMRGTLEGGLVVTLIIEAIITGILTGGVYALMSSGLTLLFGVMEI